MATLTFDIPDTVPCASCDHPILIGAHTCSTCGEISATIPLGVFLAMVGAGEVLYAKHGGLILGRNDASDDIPMFMESPAGVFRLVGFMQGGEYLMSASATKKHLSRLVQINSEKGEHVPLPAMPLKTNTTVINTNIVKPTASLWLSSNTQFIINRFATNKYLDELEKLNETV